MKPKKPGAARPAPKSLKDMRPVDRVFIHNVMFELGIIPIEDPTFDMRRPTRDTLSKDETRVLNRKFRKLWRKYMRQQVVEETAKTANATSKDARAAAIKKNLGVNKLVASRHDKSERKRLVYEKIWAEYIVPMLEKFENPKTGG